MKNIYITSICKNEINFLDRYLKSALNADKIYILDTGSTDGTYEQLQKIAKNNDKIILNQKIYTNFSFAEARNDCLAMVTDKKNSLMVQLDFDEYFYQDNWVNILRNFIEKEKMIDFFIDCPYSDKSTITLYNMRRIVPCTRMFFGENFSYDKEVHETILFKNSPWLSGEIYRFCQDIMIYHDPDLTKDRSQYVELAKKRLSKCEDLVLTNFEKSLLIMECCRNKSEENIKLAKETYESINEDNSLAKVFSAASLYEATLEQKYLDNLIIYLDEDTYFDQNIIYTLLKFAGKENLPQKTLNIIIDQYKTNEWRLGKKNLELSEMNIKIKELLGDLVD